MSVRTLPFVIAIDGPVAAGKDTVSDYVAEQLQTIHVNSGALYRMWTLLAGDRSAQEIEKNVDMLIEQHTFRLERRGRSVHYLLDEQDVTTKLYDNTVSVRVPEISRIPTIRQHVNTIIREFAGRSSIVIDGRDATTIIFPDADLKVYLDTDFEVRVQRRLTQLQQKGQNITREELAQQMQNRDETDRNKGEYSLQQAEGALYVDATGMSPEEAATVIVQTFQQKKIT